MGLVITLMELQCEVNAYLTLLILNIVIDVT